MTEAEAENGQAASDFNQADFNSTWSSINGAGGVGIGTLFHHAKENGWKQPDSLRSETDRPKRKQQRADSNKTASQKREKNESAALIAFDRWGAAQDADPDHPYLMKKGIDPVGIKQESDNPQATVNQMKNTGVKQ